MSKHKAPHRRTGGGRGNRSRTRGGHGGANQIEAIVWLGVASHGEQPEPYTSRITRALEDADPAVRDAGLVAFSHSPQASMRSRIEQLRDRDPDPGVQKRAKVLLDGWT
jgi:hypothetical protein